MYDEGSPHADPAIYSLGIPILGICYGLQVPYASYRRVMAANNGYYSRKLHGILVGKWRNAIVESTDAHSFG